MNLSNTFFFISYPVHAVWREFYFNVTPACTDVVRKTACAACS